MPDNLHNPRTPECDVDPMFVDRWSPRSFRSEVVPDHQIRSLIEAARWAPSCFNEQPWIFCYAVDEAERRRFAEALVEKNRQWAAAAPLLLFLGARRAFMRNGRPNRHAAFDAGAAWMSLAFQARKLGLHAHAMAGFDQDKAHEILALPRDRFEIMAAVAVGRRGDAAALPEDLARGEIPNERKPGSEIAFEGRYQEKDDA